MCKYREKLKERHRGVFQEAEVEGRTSQAIVATANKIARIFYAMITKKKPFDERKVGLDDKELLLRKITLAQRILDRLNLRLSVAEE